MAAIMAAMKQPAARIRGHVALMDLPSLAENPSAARMVSAVGDEALMTDDD
jgi:hypothetical protein